MTSLLTPTFARNPESRIVCCAACGAAREQANPACVFCRALFTPRELDMSAICSRCFSRISDTALFCDCCGAEAPVEDPSAMKVIGRCPNCPNRDMESRRFKGQGVDLLECKECGGMWLSHEEFRQIESAAVTIAPAPELVRYQPPRRVCVPLREFTYRKCPVCSQLMQRKQYAESSGIIHNVCPTHGIWFELEQLGQTVRWILEGSYLRALAEGERARADYQRWIEARKEVQFRDMCRNFRWLRRHYLPRGRLHHLPAVNGRIQRG